MKTDLNGIRAHEKIFQARAISICVDIQASRFRELFQVKSDGTWSPKPARESQGLRPYLNAVMKKLGKPEGSLNIRTHKGLRGSSDLSTEC